MGESEQQTKNFINELLKGNKEYQKLISEQKELNSSIQQMESQNAFKQLETESKKTNNQIKETTSQVERLNRKVEKSGETTSKSFKKGTNKILKYGAALMGIRTIYNFISSAANSYLETNDQLKTDIEYIKFAIGSAFAPILQTIVEWLYKILGIVNAVSKALFNFDIFANASANAFKKTEKSTKKIKDNLTTAGFDKANILNANNSQDNSTSTSSITPSIDLSKVNKEADDISKKMKEVADQTVSFWEEDWQDYWNFFGNEWDLAFNGLILTLEGFYMTFKGIWDIICGTIDIFVGIFTGDTEKIKEGWSQLWNGCKELLIGILEIIGGLVMSAIGLIWGIIKGLWDWIVDLFSGVGKWFGDRFNEALDNVRNIFGNIGSWFGDRVQDIKNAFGGIANWFKDTFSKAWENVKKVFSTGGKIFDGIKEGIVETFKTVVNGIITGINKVIKVPFDGINGLLNTIRNFDIPIIGKVFKGLWKQDPLFVPQIPKLARGGIAVRPTQAIIGEAGKEAVLPLQNNTEWMDILAEKVASKLSIGSDGDVIVNNYMDGDLIERKRLKKQKLREFARNGG